MPFMRLDIRAQSHLNDTLNFGRRIYSPSPGHRSLAALGQKSQQKETKGRRGQTFPESGICLGNRLCGQLVHLMMYELPWSVCMTIAQDRKTAKSM